MTIHELAGVRPSAIRGCFIGMLLALNLAVVVVFATVETSTAPSGLQFDIPICGYGTMRW
ncbi:MAG TPA: hypothetical protein VNQ99_01650 [Xanthobacteraceae bacterium]|nr:hypothetical protein [Xanthobacteraceae bacterium]